MRGETHIMGDVTSLLNDFNPLSPCGERPITPATVTPAADFNPLSPCGERQQILLKRYIIYYNIISILHK